MDLTMRQKRAVTVKMAREYRGAGKKKKTEILNTLVQVTGYNRCYAGWLLRHWGRKYLMKIDGQMVELRVGAVKKRKAVRRPREYEEPVVKMLKTIWESFDYMCGQRLAAFLKETLPVLVGAGELYCNPSTYSKLLAISGATIDRLLRPEKEKLRIRGRSHTKPTSRLKAQIPILTWSELKVEEPGHYQFDLVGHDGGSTRGEFAFSLDCEELYSGWVEPRSLKNRAHRWTVQAIDDVQEKAPVAFKSIHTDNGGEFINELLFQWCQQRGIDFYRARANRTNDTCYVEQKNFNIVRQAVGYARFETEEEVALLAELYKHLRLLVNHFYPSAKLIEKRREGAHLYKKHDAPQTPYRRLMDCPVVDEEVKERLFEEHKRLRPMLLKQRISKIQDRLYYLGRMKRSPSGYSIETGVGGHPGLTEGEVTNRF
jgi:IS30 family transposase